MCPLKNPKGACTHSILAAYDSHKNIFVGANPLHANKVFQEACKQNLFIEDFGTIQKVVAEYTHGNSRFDFFLNDSIYVEVKSVLISKNNVAQFPVGNKKNKTISERANKHISELTSLAKEGHECALVFIVLREDVDSFSPNSKDTLFCEYISNAIKNDVKIYAYQMKVDTEGIKYIRRLPMLCEKL